MRKKGEEFKRMNRETGYRKLNRKRRRASRK
jgi:hypothetical protein